MTFRCFPAHTSVFSPCQNTVFAYLSGIKYAHYKVCSHLNVSVSTHLANAEDQLT